ncbi:pheromone-regulated protein PRM5 SCDLUD_002793 [Saccharomycodes ludwigii]|uniref:pheromone-regulated protein PRM5 n=1 Tax=Saccharomycodes ludwigii TaxID=36035 RepID=UPI001E82274D|nr:hypothetical protein SCDLUD_002793 [Saccharomycodes ludwigii]KAH3901302.1 hypothetical protein SCDLUD_002793 [Saccharomycodes ludwigii]
MNTFTEIPTATNNPYIWGSALPNGTVFIIVGSFTGFLIFCIILWYFISIYQSKKLATKNYDYLYYNDKYGHDHNNLNYLDIVTSPIISTSSDLIYKHEKPNNDEIEQSKSKKQDKEDKEDNQKDQKEKASPILITTDNMENKQQQKINIYKTLNNVMTTRLISQRRSLFVSPTKEAMKIVGSFSTNNDTDKHRKTINNDSLKIKPINNNKNITPHFKTLSSFQDEPHLSKRKFISYIIPPLIDDDNQKKPSQFLDDLINNDL